MQNLHVGRCRILGKVAVWQRVSVMINYRVHYHLSSNCKDGRGRFLSSTCIILILHFQASYDHLEMLSFQFTFSFRIFPLLQPIFCCLLFLFSSLKYSRSHAAILSPLLYSFSAFPQRPSSLSKGQQPLLNC